MVHKCYDHRRGKCDSRKCEHHTEKLLLDYFGWTTILWGNSGDHLSQKSFLADSCQASLPWAFTFFQHYHRRLKTFLDSTNSRTGNRYFDNPVIKSTLWWAPFSIILTLGAETSSHHRHTHTQRGDVLDLQCHCAVPMETQLKCCAQAACAWGAFTGQCGCSTDLKVLWEDPCLQTAAWTQAAHAHPGPASTTLLWSRQLF